MCIVSKSKSLNGLKAVEICYKLAIAVRSQLAVHPTATSGSTERSDVDKRRIHNIKWIGFNFFFFFLL